MVLLPLVMEYYKWWFLCLIFHWWVVAGTLVEIVLYTCSSFYLICIGCLHILYWDHGAVAELPGLQRSCLQPVPGVLPLWGGGSGGPFMFSCTGALKFLLCLCQEAVTRGSWGASENLDRFRACASCLPTFGYFRWLEHTQEFGTCPGTHFRFFNFWLLCIYERACVSRPCLWWCSLMTKRISRTLSMTQARH